MIVNVKTIRTINLEMTEEQARALLEFAIMHESVDPETEECYSQTLSDLRQSLLSAGIERMLTNDAS